MTTQKPDKLIPKVNSLAMARAIGFVGNMAGQTNLPDGAD